MECFSKIDSKHDSSIKQKKTKETEVYTDKKAGANSINISYSTLNRHFNAKNYYEEVAKYVKSSRGGCEFK